MVNKKLLLGIPLLLYAFNSPLAQQDHLRRDENTSIVDGIEEKVTNVLADDASLLEKVGAFFKTAANSVYEFYLEEKYEHQIQENLSFIIDDPDVIEFLREYQAPKLHAEVTRFTDSTALADVEYRLPFDDSKIIRQYEFKLRDGKIDEIIDRGETWAERFGKLIPVKDLYDVIKLEKTLTERWEQKKNIFESQYSGRSYHYERTPKAFEGIQGFSPDQFKVPLDYRLISNDVSKAQVGFSYHIEDKFGNAQNDEDNFVVEEYIKTPSGWEFGDVLYSARFREGILIGTEVNKFEKNSPYLDFLKSAKQKVVEVIQEVF